MPGEIDLDACDRLPGPRAPRRVQTLEDRVAEKLMKVLLPEDQELRRLHVDQAIVDAQVGVSPADHLRRVAEVRIEPAPTPGAKFVERNRADERGQILDVGRVLLPDVFWTGPSHAAAVDGIEMRESEGIGEHLPLEGAAGDVCSPALACISNRAPSLTTEARSRCQACRDRFGKPVGRFGSSRIRSFDCPAKSVVERSSNVRIVCRARWSDKIASQRQSRLRTRRSEGTSHFGISYEESQRHTLPSIVRKLAQVCAPSRRRDFSCRKGACGRAAWRRAPHARARFASSKRVYGTAPTHSRSLDVTCKMGAMPYTREALVDELTRRGDRVTKRTISDWIRRGLLPPLDARGRGRGRGVLRTFPSDEVVEQAQAVGSLLALSRSTRAALVALWLLRHDVASASVRQALLEQVDSLHRTLAGRRATGEPATDIHIDDAIIGPFERAYSHSPECFEGFSPALVEVLVKVFAIDGYRLDPAIVDEAIAGLFASELDKRDDVYRSLFDTFSSVGSADALRDLISHAPDSAFEDAQHVVGIVEDWLWALSEPLSDHTLAGTLDVALVRIGSVVLITLLILERTWGPNVRNLADYGGRLLDCARFEARRRGCSVADIFRCPSPEWLATVPVLDVVSVPTHEARGRIS